MKNVGTIILFFCLLRLPSASAQQNVYQHFTVNDVLPSSEVYCVVQDSDGYVWLSTDRGICRYDGYNFKTFTTKDGLSDNTIFSITEDSSKRLWFFGLTGKINYLENNKIKSLWLSAKVETSVGKGHISSVCTDGSGHVFIGVDNQGIVWKLSDKDTVAIILPAQYAYVMPIGNGIVYGNCVPTRGTVKDTICYCDKKTVHKLGLAGQLSPGERILAIKADDGSCLVAIGNTLLRIRHGEATNSCPLPMHGIISMYQDHEGHIWITYNKGGAVCYAEYKAHLEPLQRYLDFTSISRVCEDLEGNFWFSSSKTGLYLLTSKDFLSYTSADGLAGNNITRVCADGQTVWFGTDHGDVYALKNAKIIKRIRLTADNNIVQSLYLDEGEVLWIGTVSNIYQYKNNRLTTLPADDGGMRAMSHGKAGYIWAGRSYIHRLDPKTGRSTTLPGFTDYIDALCQDGLGQLWIGGSDGLWCRGSKGFRYLGSGNKWLRARIKDIKLAPDSAIWLATLGEGVIREKGNVYTKFDIKKGLLNDLCNRLFIDSSGTVWVGTNEGLSRINIKKDLSCNIKNYTHASGLVSNEVHDVYRQNDKIWVATGGGLNVFDAAKADGKLPGPKVYISGVSINGKDTTVNGIYQLRFSQNSIDISFVAITYKNPGKTRYRYKMAGLDTNWAYTNFTRARYSSLPPGSYEFVVNAADANGEWSDKYTTLVFDLALPFWRTSWFWGCLAGAVLAVFGAVAWFQLNQIIQKNHLLKQLNQYKHQALSAQMNPHFIFNSLNSIQRYILENDKTSSNNYLTKFARLMRITLDNSLQTLITLDEEMEALKLYVELEKMRFKDKLTYHINISPSVNMEQVKIPALLIQPYVENAIIHGIMPKESAGNVKVDIYLEGQDLICLVQDDGVGRDYVAQVKKQGKAHRSAGMDITRNRVGIMNALYKKNMQITVTDLKNNENFSAGTLVKLKIPLY